MRSESTKISITYENKVLIQQLDVVRKELENLHKHHDDLEAKSKTEIKLLVKEVKSLRNSQAELKQELSGLIKEKLELEVMPLLANVIHVMVFYYLHLRIFWRTKLQLFQFICLSNNVQSYKFTTF